MAIIHMEDLPTGTETGTSVGLGGVQKVEEGVAGGGGLVTLPNLNMTTKSADHGDGLAFGFGLAQNRTTTIHKCIAVLLFYFSTYYDTFTAGFVASANIFGWDLGSL